MKEDITLRWIKKAEDDLKTVEYLISFNDFPSNVVCFHCQQAIEKYLKAYLTWVETKVKKVHDLETILNFCIERDKEFKNLNKEEITKLTIYAVEARYPDEYIESSIEEAKSSYETAKKVREFVLNRLKEKGFKR
jgi:HEPN domain-containing protein